MINSVGVTNRVTKVNVLVLAPQHVCACEYVGEGDELKQRKR